MIEVDLRFLMTYPGKVVDNKDPLGLKRVRVMVPGFMEPHSGWAVPWGAWGGKAQRGIYGAPEVDSDVTLGFHMGDRTRPWYGGGFWGEGEASTVDAGLSPENAAKMRAIETEKFYISFDDATGTLKITDKVGGAYVRITNNKIEIGGAATEKAMLGDTWKSKEDAILDQIQLITVNTAVGPSSVPINAGAFATIKGQLTQVLSTIVFVK